MYSTIQNPASAKRVLCQYMSEQLLACLLMNLQHIIYICIHYIYIYLAGRQVRILRCCHACRGITDYGTQVGKDACPSPIDVIGAFGDFGALQHRDQRQFLVKRMA